MTVAGQPAGSYEHDAGGRLLLISATAVLLLFCSVCGCSQAVIAPSRDIYELSLAEKHEQISAMFSNYDFCASDDPKNLMLFIEALVKTDNELPKTIEKPLCPSHIREFAKGYYAMLHGKIADALNNFSSIGGSTAATRWSAIAFIEHALYTGDISHYDQNVHLLEGTAIYGQIRNEESHLTPGMLTYYQCRRLLSTGNIDGLKQLISKKGNELNSYDKSVIEIEIYLRDDDFGKAMHRVDQLLKKYPRNQEVLVTKGAIIRLTNGDEAWLAYLRNNYSKSWLLEAHYAVGLVETGRLEEGLKILQKLATQRRLDYEHDLLSNYYSLIYGNDKQKDEALKSLNNEQYVQIPYYHVILGQLYLIRGDLANAEKQLHLAKILNPQADYVLWFEFELLKRSKNLMGAATILDEIKRLWPNDVDMLFEQFVLARELNDNKKAREYKEALLRSKRYVSPDYLKRIKPEEFH